MRISQFEVRYYSGHLTISPAQFSFYSSINNVPIYLHLQDMFHAEYNNHTYLLRSQDLLGPDNKIYHARQHRRTLSLIGPTLWNDLSKEIQNY